MKKLFALILCLVTSSLAHAGLISTRSTAPATCTVGDVWINPGAATNDRIYTCTATNTWTKNSGRPWVIQSTAPSDLSLIWFDDDQVPGYLVLKLHNGTTWVAQAMGEGGSYTLPTASSDTLGGIKVGSRLSITDGVLSADVQSGSVPSGTVNGQVLLWATDQWVASTAPWLTTASLGTGVATALGFAPNTSGGFLLYSTYAADPLVEWGTGITETADSPTPGTNTISITYPVTAEAWSGSGWNGDTSGLSRNDAYDYLHIADTDDDGLPDKVDASDGLLKVASNVLSAATAGTDYLTPTNLATGSTDNAVIRANGTGGKTTQASGVTIDDSDNLTTPGTLNGKTAIVVNGDTASYSVTQAQARANTLFLTANAATTTYTLPTAEAGMVACFKMGQGNSQVLRIDTDGTDYIVKSTGARTSAAGDYYGATASATNRICVAAYDATDWYVESEVGTWSEE